MKILRSIFASTFLLIIGCNAQASDIDLKMSTTDFLIRAAGLSQDEKSLCLAGSYVDDDEAKSFGRLMAIDLLSKKIIFEKKIPAPKDMEQLRLVSCSYFGNAIYVNSVADSDTVPSLKHEVPYIYQFSQDGKQIGLSQINTKNSDSWVYAIQPIHKGFSAIGLGKSKDGSNTLSSSFISNSQAELAFSELKTKNNGGYEPNAIAKFIDNTFIVAGNFHPYKTSNDILPDDYAISRISLSGNYIWSVRPQKITSTKIATAISETGETFSIGFDKQPLVITSVDQNGKIIRNFSLPSQICEIKKAVATQRKLIIFGSQCNANNLQKISILDIESKRESIADLSDQLPQNIFILKTNLVSVLKDRNNHLSLRIENIVGK